MLEGVIVFVERLISFVGLLLNGLIYLVFIKLISDCIVSLFF